MSEYTKGPWEFYKHEPHSQWFGNIIGHPNPEDRQVIRTILCLTDYCDTDKEQEANAHLISAAPDYDEAACEFIEAWEDGGCMDELKGIYFKFVSAKAKARGRE